jgi:transcriptional regulator with PAS, ATPase and Fis domain
MDVQSIKQRFEIIGNSPLLERAIYTAMQVAPTDISVLVTGESGVGKEVFPKIIHQLSARKHGNYIAVNCGAIPEGTIDSELFGHEKGSFTGATDSRKGYFEVANGGTIFLDEVAELPKSTQVRLLRVLETGEFIRVGSSKVIKTDVRVVAASNVNIPKAIEEDKFREDLYYRLNTVPINIPPLRERKDDIYLLFRKFVSDVSDKYHMPHIRLTEEAKKLLVNYRWQGNIRQLKNITEQIAIIESDKEINKETLANYLPDSSASNLPVLFRDIQKENEHISERDLLYKVLFDMKKDITDLKKLIGEIMESGGDMGKALSRSNTAIVKQIKEEGLEEFQKAARAYKKRNMEYENESEDIEQDYEVPIQESEVVEESLSIKDKEIELIKRALSKNNGKRKAAAEELGISERTLYRKIKEYDIS